MVGGAPSPTEPIAVEEPGGGVALYVPDDWSQLVRVAGQNHLCVPRRQARERHQRLRLCAVTTLVKDDVAEVGLGESG